MLIITHMGLQLFVAKQAGTLRDAFGVFIRQLPLGQRRKADHALALVPGFFQQLVFLHRAVKDGIAILVDDKGRLHIVALVVHTVHGLAVIIAHTHIQGLAPAHQIRQAQSRLLQRRVRGHTVVVKNIHILQPHPLQALVQGSSQVLAAAAPTTVRARPHLIPGLGADNQLIPVRAQIFLEYAAKVDLCPPRLRPVIISQVKMGHPMVKGR